MCRAKRLTSARPKAFARGSSLLGRGGHGRSPGVRVFGMVLVLAGLTLVASVTLVGFRLFSPAVAPSAPSGPVVVHLAIHAVNGVDTVASPNVTVPAGSRVTFYLANYDPVAMGAPMSAAAVEGEFEGSVALIGAGTSVSTPFTGLAPVAVSHTFTMSVGSYQFNVPVPASPRSDAPVVAVFTLTFNATGTFRWFCSSFCDHGGTDGPGLMGGTITVT